MSLSLAGVFGGSVKSLRALVSGEIESIPRVLVNANEVRKFQRTFQSIYWLLPKKQVTSQDNYYLCKGKLCLLIYYSKASDISWYFGLNYILRRHYNPASLNTSFCLSENSFWVVQYWLKGGMVWSSNQLFQFQLWNKTEIVVFAPEKNYTVYEYADLLTDAGYVIENGNISCLEY